jgi:hypothetical protein
MSSGIPNEKAVKLQIVDFRIVMPCRLTGDYSEDGDDTFLQKCTWKYTHCHNQKLTFHIT